MYENERWPIDTSRIDPVDLLNYLIEEGGRTQAELAELLGSRSRASEILNRKRALTVEMIHKLNTEWKVPAELLIKPYPLKAA
jgi:HTH-type transcriptional regulator/antitoxin HigA